MVQIKKRFIDLQAGPRLAFYSLIGIAAVAIATIIVWEESENAAFVADIKRLTGMSQDDLLVEDNSNQVKAWRQSIRQKCQAALNMEQVMDISKINKHGFVMSSVRKEQPRGDSAVRRCTRVVMDFGANIGDTSGKLIDAGMIGCSRPDIGPSATTPEVAFNVETKQFADTKRRNPLVMQFIKLMGEQGQDVGPEDYCYYGIEGNPVFTERLQGIEDFVLAMRPRPLRHIHFFTESVGAGEDGPTTLYLDTVNTAQNFWGSSIMKGHQDVKKSAANGDGKVEQLGTTVTGYTIGTLMRKTLKAFESGASPEDKKGNHLILKVDIEGGEYPLLHQAADEGTLCEFVKMGNKADLYIEFHSKKVTGDHEFVGRTQEMKDKLIACGVTFRNLAAWWA